MGKRKKGRTRGRGGMGGPMGMGGPHNGRPRGHGPRRFKDQNDRAPYPEGDLGPDNGEPGVVEPGMGVLELHPNGYGFLRNPKTNYLRERSDPFVPGTMIEKFRLREGLMINGLVQQA